MRVLNYVYNVSSALPSILCIQANNYIRKNKNKYLFRLCTTLVSLGYFEEIRVSFLLIGHTHLDTLERFNYMSHVSARR
jgi:hypothetical protein